MSIGDIKDFVGIGLGVSNFNGSINLTCLLKFIELYIYTLCSTVPTAILIKILVSLQSKFVVRCRTELKFMHYTIYIVHYTFMISQMEYTQRVQKELRRKHAMQNKQQPKNLRRKKQQIHKQFEATCKIIESQVLYFSPPGICTEFRHCTRSRYSS